MSLSVRVTARASKTAVGPLRDGVLQVRVTAAPVDDAANVAVAAAIAAAFGVARRAVAITAGHTSRNKIVRIDGVTADEVSLVVGG